MTPALLRQILAARTSESAVVVLTGLTSGRQEVLSAENLVPSLPWSADVSSQAAEALRLDRSTLLPSPEEPIFIHVFNPPLKLVVIGAVHIAQALVPMAERMGFRVSVVDPRGAFATAERFPGVQLLSEWPDQAMLRVGLDARTAVVALTHDPKLDDSALAAALRSQAFYIGALGSKKNHAVRVGRLRERGFSEAELGRIHGPVGLAIGATSPAEIALSILAQIVAVLRLGAPP
jgi:xanthine dehydrogenase accessory factor